MHPEASSGCRRRGCAGSPRMLETFRAGRARPSACCGSERGRFLAIGHDCFWREFSPMRRRGDSGADAVLRVDADRVDEILDSGVERARDSCWLRSCWYWPTPIEAGALHEVRRAVLQPTRDRDRAADRLRPDWEIPSRRIPTRIDRGAGLRDHRLGSVFSSGFSRIRSITSFSVSREAYRCDAASSTRCLMQELRQRQQAFVPLPRGSCG